MSYRPTSPRALFSALASLPIGRALSFAIALPFAVALSGCGVIGQNQLAEDSETTAEIEVISAEAGDNATQLADAISEQGTERTALRNTALNNTALNNTALNNAATGSEPLRDMLMTGSLRHAMSSKQSDSSMSPAARAALAPLADTVSLGNQPADDLLPSPAHSSSQAGPALTGPWQTTVDMPSIPLTPVMPVGSRTNLLKRQSLSESPPVPRLGPNAATDDRRVVANSMAAATTAMTSAIPAEYSEGASSQAASSQAASSQGASTQEATRQPAPPEPLSAKQLDSRVPRTVQKVAVADFQRTVLKSDVPVIVDFYADWCRPCKLVAPILEQLAHEQDGLRVVKVNVDDDPKLAKKYRVSTYPTVLLFKEGKLVARWVGLDEIRKAVTL